MKPTLVAISTVITSFSVFAASPTLRKASISAPANSVNVTPLPAAPQYIEISAVGDIMMGTNFPENKLPSDEGRKLFVASSQYIQAGDIRFGNFEGTLYDGNPMPDGKRPGPNRWLFRTPTEMKDRISEAGFNVMSLANNHSKDFGRNGLRSTEEALADLNVQYSSKDGEIAQFKVRGLQVALIAMDFSPGHRSLTNPDSTLLEIKQLKEKFDIVIVSCHAGAEGKGATHVTPGPEFFMGENRGDSVGFAHAAIDNGADLIIMHGPHVPRGMEVYRERLIAYSLGNFLTGQGISIQGDAGLAPLLRVQLDAQGRFTQGHLASFIQTRNQGTVYDPGQGAFELVKELSQSDFPGSAPKFMDNGFLSP